MSKIKVVVIRHKTGTRPEFSIASSDFVPERSVAVIPGFSETGTANPLRNTYTPHIFTSFLSRFNRKKRQASYCLEGAHEIILRTDSDAGSVGHVVDAASVSEFYAHQPIDRTTQMPTRFCDRIVNFRTLN